MKKLASFLTMFLLIVALLLTGCGADKKATAESPNNSVNKVSSNIGETKTKDTSPVSENENNSSHNSEAQVAPIKTETPKTTDNAQSQENAKNVTSTHTTENQANPSPQTSTNQANSSPQTSTSQASPSPQTSTSQAPIPIKTENTDKKAVTIAINCSTAVAKGLDKEEKFKDVVPANGIILSSTKVEFQDGETVFDVLKSTLDKKKIHMSYKGSKTTAFIQEINYLSEFDGGSLSGWMYSANGVYPNDSCGQYKVKDGDIIQWSYTCDMGKDLGQK